MDTLYIELKSPDPIFFLFADHLPASLLNPLESVSDLKGNLRPVLGLHRRHYKSQNKLTAALFLEQDDVEHTVLKFQEQEHVQREECLLQIFPCIANKGIRETFASVQREEHWMQKLSMFKIN